MTGSQIDKLASEIKNCTICRDSPIVVPLPHEPRPVVVMSSTARIVICGQAPGTRVHQSGMPFTDPSGERLRDWLAVSDEVFYDVSKFAIVPMGFCFPGNDATGGDLPPRKECALNWHDNVFEAMPQLELFVLIGLYAQKYHLGGRAKKSLTDTVANWEEYFQADEKGRRYLPLPHPSWRNSGWIKKNAWFERGLLPVLKKEIQLKLG